MRPKSILSAIFAILLLIVPILALNIPVSSMTNTSSFPAQDEDLGPWIRTNGPYGGLINSIEIDPTNPNVLYAAGGGLSIYKSINSGGSWSVVGTLNSSSRKVVEFEMAPLNPQVMYALTQGDEYINPEFFMSVDGGENWSQVDQNMQVFDFAVHPSNPMFILAVMWSAFVFVTDDGGASWTNVTGNLPREAVVDIAISGDNEYWAGLGDFKNESGSLYHTTDGGISWQREDNAQPPRTFINSIMVHPNNPGIVYVSLTTAPDETINPDHSYLSRTLDAGAAWDELNTTTTLRLLSIVPGIVNDTIYASYGAYVLRTSDYGANWEDITPPPVTSDINDIEIDPDDNNTIYIPKRTYGVYKSTDGGYTWVTLTEGLDNTNACLVVVPHDVDSETVYVSAVEGTGTFRTDDAGGTWFYLDGGGINHSFTDEIRVSPHDSNIVWQIADIGQIFITNNKGTTWTTKYQPQHGYGFRYSSVHTIESAPSDEAIIYAIKSGWGPFRSDDGGLTWDFLAQSEIDYSYTLAIHPTNPDVVYSGYNPKPFQDWAMVRKSTDGGISWETVLNVTGSNGITSVAIDPNSPNVVYAGSIGKHGGEVYKTIDGGTNWAKLNDNFTMCTVMAQPQLVVDPSNPAIAYIGTWLGGTWKTVDAGATWGFLENAPASATAIKIDPQNSNTLYLADRSTPTVWKSVDAGDTWFDIADFTADGAFLVNNLHVDGDIVYCATFGPPTTGGDLYKSIDAGATWNSITGILPRSVLDIAVDPVSPEIVYVTTHVKGAYKSINGGSTWSELVGFPDVGGFDIEVNASNPTILYAAALGETAIPDWVDSTGFTFTNKSGVYKSIDSGLTWTSSLNTTEKCRAVRFYPGNSTILYAVAHGGGLFVSDDAGVTWTNYVLGLDTTGLTSLDIQGDTIYVGTQGYGVYSGDINTADFSVTWQPSRSNKPIPQVYSMQIVVDPNDSNRIYVGSYPGGLYRSDDGGATFYDKNFQTPSIIPADPLRQGYYAFVLNSTDTSNVWLGTWGGGVLKSIDAMDHNVHADGLGMTMMGKHIYQLAVSPNPPYTVYAATEEGVWITEDAGATWTNFSAGLLSLQVRSIEITAGGGLLCGTLGYGMHVFNPVLEKWVQLPPFSNLGNVWPIWNDRPSYQYSSLLFHPTDPNIIYMGVFPAGIYKSIDGGETWFESNTGFTNDGVFALVHHPQGAEIIYAGTYNGVSRSMDYGATWEKIEEGMPPEQWVFSIDFDSRNPSIMYACSKNGENEGLGVADFRGTVMKSIDAGETWFEITSGLNTTQEFYKIIVDKHNPDIIYLATERDGVFISYTNGDSWEPWNVGLTNLRAGSSGNNVANPMVQSADGRYLYFGTFGSGVWRRTTYIPPTTTTTTTSATSTTTTSTITSMPPPPVPIEFMVLVAGAFSAAIMLILVVARIRKGSGK